MKNRHDTAEAETPEQLIEHISRLMAEAEAMLAGPVTAEHETSRIAAIKSRLDTARAQLGDVYGRARDQVVAGARHADETIREYPYYAIGVAVGLGVLMGVILGRQGRRSE